MTVKIMLVDDNEHIRRGLRKLIGSQPGWEVCGEAEDGQEAIKQAQSLCPDLIVMDIGLPKIGGAEATQAILSQMPQIKIVGFSVHSSPAVLDTMMQAGASGFVTKARAYEELIEAVKSVLAGGLYVSTFTGEK